ncbi:hypothetical protein SAY87_012581 [Trapa incisa]|uniref:NPF family transporter n=1 Tax=Trapa incisa TaxID=236973 RepID=A0AAN7GQE6_9MYRT|nr:hypothetical protein SAY87_012581 [Trapa incisa]
MDKPSTKFPFQSLATMEEAGVAHLSQEHEEDQGRSVPQNLVDNGCIDMWGRIADKWTTGGWKASPFIIANEVAERLAFFAVSVNMVQYLTMEMRQSLPAAVTHVSNWIGAAYILTLLGAFLADSYLGRFLTIISFSCIYAAGMIMLTLLASIHGLHPGPCEAKECPDQATGGQTAFLYLALALIALGTGGIKPCVSSFGADQFDESDPREAHSKYAFFNWFFFAINMGALLGITLLIYLQAEKGWVWGFAVPTATMILSMAVLAAGARYYRYQKPKGSPFTRFLQVIVAAVRNHLEGAKIENERTFLYEARTRESIINGAPKLAYTSQYRFLDKAALQTDQEKQANTSPWRLCTVTQVEEMKSFIRVLPVWASTIAFAICFAQNTTFFISQAAIMDRSMGPNFEIPAGSVPVFGSINALLLVPIYERYIVPFLRGRTGHRRGITSLQRMGLGLAVSVMAMAAGALVEAKRRNHPNPSGVSVFSLFPQNFLMGMAEVFTYVGQLEFFYDEATDGTRSISSAMFLSEIGIGSWLNTALVKIVGGATGGQQKGWFRQSLNDSRLDYYYWVLAAINAVNFMVYLTVACNYKSKNAGPDGVTDDQTQARLGGQFQVKGSQDNN